MRKMLYIHPLDCTGCRNCEIACSYIKEGLMNPKKARIHPIRIGAVYDNPVVCRQCRNPPCAKNCPVNAIEDRGNIVYVDEKKCIGCGVCVQECPFGAIAIHPDKGVAIKCDQCGHCIKYCPTGKLRFIDINEIAHHKGLEHAKRRDAALKVGGVKVAH